MMASQSTANVLADEDDYLTTKELAALLKRSLDTLRDWRDKGTGPTFIKMGRAVMYPRTAVNEWLSERLATNTEQAEARLRKERLAKLKPGDEDYAINTLMAALATLPPTIDGIETWRNIQCMELEHTDSGEVRVKDMTMRHAPVTDEDLQRLNDLNNE